MIEYGGQPAEFSIKVVGIHRSCLVRQVNVAVRIIIQEAGCIMNSKSEFHHAPLVRAVPTSGLLEEQGAWAEPGPGPASGMSLIEGERREGRER